MLLTTKHKTTEKLAVMFLEKDLEKQCETYLKLGLVDLDDLMERRIGLTMQRRNKTAPIKIIMNFAHEDDQENNNILTAVVLNKNGVYTYKKQNGQINLVLDENSNTDLVTGMNHLAKDIEHTYHFVKEPCPKPNSKLSPFYDMDDDICNNSMFNMANFAKKTLRKHLMDMSHVQVQQTKETQNKYRQINLINRKINFTSWVGTQVNTATRSKNRDCQFTRGTKLINALKHMDVFTTTSRLVGSKMQYQLISTNIVISILMPNNKSHEKPIININTNNAFDEETLYQLSKVNNIINEHLDNFN